MASPISAFGKRFLLGLRIPAAAPHVDMAVGPEGHAFVFQQDFLFGPGGNRPSLTVHHPVARQAGRCRSPMQRLSYHARAQRPASQRGDLPVGCDAAGRNSPHDVVYFSVKSFAIHRFRRPVRFVCRRNPLSLCVGARFPRCGYGVRSRPAHTSRIRVQGSGAAADRSAKYPFSIAVRSRGGISCFARMAGQGLTSRFLRCWRTVAARRSVRNISTGYPAAVPAP